jgi:hypothetical protein
MNEDERYHEICKPALDGIRGDLDLLKKHLILGNGKPSLLNRVDALERGADKATGAAAKEARSFAIGKLIVLKGYGPNDVIRIVIVLGVLWLVFSPMVERYIK